MEEENKETVEQNVPATQERETLEQPTVVEKDDTVNLNLKLLIEITFYVIGIVCLIYAIKWYGKDLNFYSNHPFQFSEERYVGGDAYNYIISAARSSAVVGKSIFWSILAGTSIVCGRLTAITRTKCK